MTDAGQQRRIVVGVDGSESSLAALRWAARQAGLTGAHLEAVTTWRWPMTYGYPMPVTADYDPAADATQILDDALARASGDLAGLDVRKEAVEGDPAQVLVDRSAGADLLVVGNRGHRELVGMLLGSVSEYCVSHAHCPVLVLRA